MATSLNATQRAIYFHLPAEGSWMTGAEVLRRAGLPSSAAPRISELRQMGYILCKRLAKGTYGYQRAPEFPDPQRAPMDLGGGE